ncbi:MULTISPECIES: sulfite exporter TauE/SafE family protein [unclassified Leptolyngbya]|uniref:sulfite exporter TauE/SafE family protein n=1 Tax=unclassified Leptolyngbya TaxID=2650499 RepID=UPI001684B9F5|nr:MULTISPECIES: sulfite exporter TauE/SafE family protein [unclassified Leptolyngbya]MBD1909912.1 sulfite exporter TauE/SafE family protein [Leptolyngbya sp. FACHB-8]MBD2158624.1 sulfite exporter TauE/SafE family protein [Leptolyngbya sp. FACHB-16]
MTPLEILLLASIFLAASIISVIAGSTSLVTVPIMFVFGVEPSTAIATNMFALTFMSIGGTLPFIGKGVINTKRLPLLIGLTLISSILGALLVLIIPSTSIPLVVSISMIAVSILSVINQKAGLVTVEGQTPCIAAIAGYVVTFLLGIYGGFFSGGYVTLLTAAYVMLFRMRFVEAIATTKLINVFSSLIATLIFMHQGMVDYPLGVILGASMFVGGLIGANLTLKLSNAWIQRIYLTVIAILICVTLRNYQRQAAS